MEDNGSGVIDLSFPLDPWFSINQEYLAVKELSFDRDTLFTIVHDRSKRVEEIHSMLKQISLTLQSSNHCMACLQSETECKVDEK
jgi:hypothetical protein